MVARGKKDYSRITFVIKKDKATLKLYLDRYNHFMHELLMFLIQKGIVFEEVEIAWLVFSSPVKNKGQPEMFQEMLDQLRGKKLILANAARGD